MEQRFGVLEQFATSVVRTNIKKLVTVTDIRGHEGEFSLDKQGFHVSPFSTFVDGLDENTDFEGRYYQDVVAHLKKVYVVRSSSLS